LLRVLAKILLEFGAACLFGYDFDIKVQIVFNRGVIEVSVVEAREGN
jgi:hypothetical protein